MATKFVAILSVVFVAVSTAPQAVFRNQFPVQYQQPGAVAYRPVQTPVAYQAPVAIQTPVAYQAPARAYAQQEPNFDPNPQYEFSYSVDDPETGDSKSHEEARNGDAVQGRYSVVESDGSRRTVEYTADAVNGFNAVVHREAGAAPAPPVFAKAAAPVQYAQPAPVRFAQPAPVRIAQPAPVRFAQPAPVQYAQPAPVRFAQPAPVPVVRYAQPAPTVQYQEVPVQYQPVQNVPVRYAQPQSAATGVRTNFASPFSNFAY